MKTADNDKKVMTALTTVFLCESNDINRLGAKAIIESSSDLKLVGDSSNPLEAIKKIEQLSPDVVVIDPSSHPWQPTLSAVKANLPSKLVAFSSDLQAADVMQALKAGATAYFSKHGADSKNLNIAIRAAASGCTWLCPYATQRLRVSLSPDVPQVEFAPPPTSEFSERELEVLRLLIEGASNLKMAQQLNLSPETVKSHLRRIMNKLQVTSRTSAAVKAIEMKLVELPN